LRIRPFTQGNAGNGIARTGWVWWPQYSITSPQNFGKFPATTGYSFSNWYGTNGTLQGVLRLAF
jgi:hypothetical protein